MAALKRSALGRGLDALITMDDLKTGGSSSISEIELSKIQPNPEQPRSVFEEETLEELATSIRSLGVIQPITLKEIGPEQYMIISGERRYRASLKAGLERIPAYIKTAADENVVEMALIENIQREDLNSIEIALAYQKLIDNYGLTQEGLSERVGKKRATIANYLRLLKLPAEIQVGLKDKKIDMGHARALIPVDDPEVQLALYEQILAQGLSVRNVEEMVRNIAEGIQPELPEKKKSDRKPILPEEFKLLKDHLSRYFNTKVQLTCNEKGKGKITIPFATEEELEQLMAADSVGVPEVKMKLAFKPNPTKAVLFALVPGLGQIYNRKYWKLPIVYGGLMGCMYAVTWNNKNYKDYSTAYKDIMYDAAKNLENPDAWSKSWQDLTSMAPEDAINNSNFKDQLKRQKDYFRRYRDLSIIITVGVYALSIVDAYVDAQLFDFDISPDLSLHLEPVVSPKTSVTPRTYGLNCSLKF